MNGHFAVITRPKTEAIQITSSKKVNAGTLPLEIINKQKYHSSQMKSVTKKWTELAQYDFKSAKVMLSSRRYLYVAFMCQQSVEKYLKAYLAEKTDTPPPYTHNLAVLAKISGLNFSEDRLKLFAVLTRHYINTRYPAVKERLSKTLNLKTTTDLYNKTRDAVQCLKNELKTSEK